MNIAIILIALFHFGKLSQAQLVDDPLTELNCTSNSLSRILTSLGLKTDASFLGAPHHQMAGPVNYTYFLIGPEDATETLVMIPGSGSIISYWSPVLLQLLSTGTRGRQVMIYDSMGMPLSPISSSNYHPVTTFPVLPISVDGMAQSTYELLSALGLSNKNTSILGHSLGGLVALRIAELYGSHLGKIIAADAPPTGPNATLPSSATLSEELHPTSNLKQLGLLFNLSTRAGVSAACNLVEGSFMISTSIGELFADDTTTNAQNQAEKAADASAVPFMDLSRISNQVLLIQGQEDILVPPANGILLASAIQGAWLAQIPNAGHGAIFQDAVQVSALINAFLLPAM